MSRIRRQSKTNGLVLLRGRWLQADVILLLTALMVFGVTMLETAVRKMIGAPMQDSSGMFDLSAASWITSGVFSVVTLLVVTPVFAGQTQWYWSLSERAPLGVGDVFAWFGSLRMYLKSIGVAADIFIRSLLWGALTCGAPAAMIAAAYYFFPEGSVSTQMLDSDRIVFVMLVGIGGVLLVGGIFLLCFIMMRYFLAFFLLAEDNSRPVREIVRESVRYTRGQRWELLKFCLSFILWFIQIYFILPALFVLPYFGSASAMYAKHIIYSQRAKERADRTPADRTPADAPSADAPPADVPHTDTPPADVHPADVPPAAGDTKDTDKNNQ